MGVVVGQAHEGELWERVAARVGGVELFVRTELSLPLREAVRVVVGVAVAVRVGVAVGVGVGTAQNASFPRLKPTRASSVRTTSGAMRSCPA